MVGGGFEHRSLPLRIKVITGCTVQLPHWFWDTESIWLYAKKSGYEKLFSWYEFKTNLNLILKHLILGTHYNWLEKYEGLERINAL